MNTSGNADEKRKLLRIYCNDHLMGSAGAIDLARRCLRSNQDTPLGDFLGGLLTEIIEDRASLEGLMAALGLGTNKMKLVAAGLGERVGRLKLNGRLLGYSDLSRLIELEGLAAGIELKQGLWQTLQRISVSDELLAEADLERLMERASSQRSRLEPHRLEAAERAFA